MKFGKTLYEKIADEWRCYAVDYSSLKKVLKGPEPDSSGTSFAQVGPQKLEHVGPASPLRRRSELAVPDAGLPPKPSSPTHGLPPRPSSPTHRRVASGSVSVLRKPSSAAAALQNNAATASTERTERITNRSRNVSWDLGTSPPSFADVGGARRDDIDIKEFFRIFECSKERVQTFHDEKKAWALSRMRRLEGWVEPTNSTSGQSSSESSSSHPPAEMRRQVDVFDEELGHIIEFLQLNQTAFSKILKKFDKNTGLVTREEKLAELRQTHGFLDGATFSELKGRVSKLRLKVIRLQSKIESQKKEAGDDKPVKSAKSVAEEIRKARVERAEALRVDRAERYLRKMEHQSVFFSENIPRQLPRFSNAEIEMGNELGQGEFSTVKEITKFLVKESCHLCFFHQRGSETQSVQSDLHKADTPSVQGSSEDTKEGQKGDPITIVATPPSSFALPTMDRSDSSDSHVGMPFDDDVSDYDELEDDHNEEELEGRGFMKDHCLRDGNGRYAIKRLRKDLPDEVRKEASLDLAIEAKFLATLSHPNIIKQRGTYSVPGHSNFMIVLDRLFDNLTEKRDFWRKEKENCKRGHPFGLFSKKDKKVTLAHLWADRLTAVYDVTRAMKYLHENNIVYRDLKPDNIGFDIRGDVKLFDFGLAKELLYRDQVGPDQYRASGLTGSRRYMAPEVVMCKHYGLSADVFSFGILLWEILALKEPFEDYDVQKHSRLVVQKQQRPKMKRSWPTNIKVLIERCWSHKPSKRPTFAEIYQIMRQDIPELRGASAKLSLSERTRFLMDRSVVSLYADYNADCQEVEGQEP